ncbi:MAG: alpha/beta hydrolase [Erysipelotrichaceae bacterium]
MKTRRSRPVFIAMLLFIAMMGFYLSANMELPARSKLQLANLLEKQGYDALVQESSQVGLVIFPEHRIAKEAYYQTMQVLQESLGVDVYVVDYPLQITWLSSQTLARIQAQAEGITSWVLLGHGAGVDLMLTQATDEKLVVVDGIVKRDLSEYRADILSIYASRSGIVDTQSELASHKLYPSSTQFVTLEGANHSYFADIDVMAEDHVASFNQREQIEKLSETIKSWIAQ